jgi:hypothetical protein
MRKNESKYESNQALLARVTKEMDEPRMAKSVREEEVNQATPEKLESYGVAPEESAGRKRATVHG